jgi:hypothetical protein
MIRVVPKEGMPGSNITQTIQLLAVNTDEGTFFVAA